MAEDKAKVARAMDADKAEAMDEAEAWVTAEARDDMDWPVSATLRI